MSTLPQLVRQAVGRTISFRARIVLVVFVTTTAFALFVVDRSSHYLRDAYSGGAMREVLAVARTFDGQLQPSAIRDRRMLLQRLDRLAAGNPEVRKASIYVIGPDGRGRRIGSTARNEIDVPASAHDVAPIRTGRARLEDVRGAGRALVELNYPLRGDRRDPYAALGLYFDRHALDESFARGRRNLLVVGLAAALVSAGLAALILGLLVFRPIAKLRAATQRLLAGDLTGRLNWRRTDDLGALARDVDQMAVAVEEREHFASLALKDPLTGLANHRHFDAVLDTELELAAGEGTSVAVGLLDLDHFKRINDLHGHPFGDEVLRRAADVLRGSVRSRDLVARMGGEEFAVILPGCDDAAGVEVVDKARRALGAISLGDRMLSASAGVAAFPDDADDRATLLERADGALYWAKHSGRDTTRRYDPHHVVSPERADRDEIAAVLEHPAGITPVFQPIVELATGTVAGYEALARFPHTEAHRGPRAWLGRAQRLGQRDRLEAKALRAALEHPGRPPGTFLAVNLSPSLLACAAVRDALPDDLSALMIEVTEEAVVTGGAAISDVVEELRHRGARIAVDDASAGFAALGRLATLRPDVIKLDASLISGVHADPARVAVIASLVTFAEHTGGRFCAKSIEGLDDLGAVAEAGVTFGQGHALARPAPGWPQVAPDALRVLRAVREARTSPDHLVTAAKRPPDAAGESAVRR